MVVKITCSRSPGTAALPSAMYDFNCVKIESQCFSIEAMPTKLWSAIGFVIQAINTWDRASATWSGLTAAFTCAMFVALTTLTFWKHGSFRAALIFEK